MDDFARFDERMPIASIEAEQAVLGSLMLVPESLVKVSDWLTAEDFLRTDHQLIYRAVCGLAERNAPCDPITMGDWFEAHGIGEEAGGPGYLLHLANTTPSAANVVAHAEIVVERSRLRRAAYIGARIQQQANRPGAASDAIVGDAVHQLSGMHASRMRGGLESARPAMTRMQNTLMARYLEAEAAPAGAPVRLLGLPWPWADLNRDTKGLRPGVLYVVGARPSMGKTVFALQIAIHNALHGKNVAFFTVEMTADEVMARAVACEGHIAHDWVESPTPHDPNAEDYWPRLTAATSRLIDAPLLIDETPGISIDQLMARARRAHIQRPLDMIVIDHMHDMWVDPRKEARHEYGRIAQGAKTLAKELRIPVVLLAQLNREVSKRKDPRPVMSDLRESGEIEQKADVILFLHRDDYYDPTSARRGLVDVIKGKGRNIKVGQSIELVNRFDQMRLDEYSSWEPPFDPAPSSIEKFMPRGFKG
ncbi:replicative DNA helicase [Luteibacter aegosomaticola]|uniref:replicative DNA helicase n=1 Tax=Luteibacter aegosomaticola TaxID=2911538 RepID=UPI001FFA9406|nr:replicative DNA helicase [Luteibacter aegosomaticola]UPG89295.1 replicative DNA helicase [Luteibacter aegosomaticola]